MLLFDIHNSPDFRFDPRSVTLNYRPRVDGIMYCSFSLCCCCSPFDRQVAELVTDSTCLSSAVEQQKKTGEEKF